MINYYEILQINENADASMIKVAYKTLAKKYHPDVSNYSNCAEMMRKVNEAYDILGNSIKKRDYDLELNRYKEFIFLKQMENINNTYHENMNKSKKNYSYTNTSKQSTNTSKQDTKYEKSSQTEYSNNSYSNELSPGFELIGTIFIYSFKIGLGFILPFFISIESFKSNSLDIFGTLSTFWIFCLVLFYGFRIIGFILGMLFKLLGKLFT